MKNFLYEGVSYNLTSFAVSYHVSYSKLRRLCRHYERAHKDPVVACRWVLGVEVLNSEKERKTILYQQDLEKSYERHERFLEKIEETFFKELCEQA